jgi:sugar diacid utilization regulator
MNLRDLVNTPQLGIRALYADDAMLDRPVGWTYTTDLPDPSRYLSPGLVVMTGLMWRRDASDSDGFVKLLTDADVAALIAGEGLLGYVPEDVIDACRAHGLPLLAVSPTVSFVDVTEYVAGAHTQDRVTRLTSTLVRQRQLLAEVAEGQALDEVVSQVARESGMSCWVVTSTGRQIVTASGELTDEQIDAITEVAMSARHLPAVAEVEEERGTVHYSVFAVGSSAESRVTGWFLVVRGNWTQWEPNVVDAMAELRAIAALDRSRSEGSRRAWFDITDETIRLVTHESDRPETATHLRQIGVDLTRPVVVVVAGLSTGLEGASDARWILTDAVSHLGTPVVGLNAEGDAVALVTVDKQHRVEKATATLSRAIERLAPALDSVRLSVGLSQPSSAAALGGAVRSAWYSRQLGQHHDHSVHVVRSAEVDSAVVLLNSVPDNLRRTFAENVLGPVMEYDNKAAASLLPTLRAYFECAGSWSKTAAMLDLHLNTVRYRIARIESLTQRDVSKMEDRMDLYLALHLL